MTATVSTGHDPEYLLGQVATGAENYYLKAIEISGEPPGVWLGDGAAELGLTGEVDPDVMREMYTHLTDPRFIDEARRVTDARIQEWRAAHPEVDGRSKEFREAKARIQAEVRAEYRMGTAIRDFTPSTEREIAKKIAELGPDATPEAKKKAEMAVRLNAPATRRFHDLTVSVSKSTSLLHAGYQASAIQLREAGDIAGAEAMEAKAAKVLDAVRLGNQAALDYMQKHAGYAREGRTGHKGPDGQPLGRRVTADKWTVASFLQHLSRDEDPQLHIHNAIHSRVKVETVDPVTGKTGEKWLSIDSNGLRAHALAAGFLAERVTAEAIASELGVRYEWRPDGKAIEVMGISGEMRDKFSARRQTITKKLGELAAAYEDEHGRMPSPHVLAKMAQIITIDPRLRPGKKDAVSREELLERWEQASVEHTRETLAGVPASVEQAAAEHGLEAEAFDPEAVIKAAVERTQAERSTFTRNHMMANIARELPACLGGLDVDQVAQLLGDLTDMAVEIGAADGSLVALEAEAKVAVPVQLLREDGECVYTRHQGTMYATRDQLDVEQALRDMTKDRSARALDPEVVEELIRDRGLNEKQAAAVRGITTSGRRAEVLVGPGGTGKSYTLATVTDVWEATGGRVLGLAASQAAANVLADEGITETANLAELLTYNKLLAQGVSNETTERYRIRPEHLVIVDEASMADTPTLNAVRKLVRAAGAKMVTAGDYEQISAVGAGGAFKAMADELGEHAHQLEEVRRFAAEWEGPASLRLRTGDTEVLTEYAARGRFRHGTFEEMVEATYETWVADIMNGRESVMVTGTNKTAGMLASRAREDLIRLGWVSGGETVELPRQETAASVGDRVVLRHIDRTVQSHSGNRFAVNRDVVQVVGVDAEHGRMTVRYDDGEVMELPPTYVRDYVELAYAGTLNSVQGRTVYACRTLVEPGMTRQALYVGMSRGTAENTGFVPTDGVPGARVAVGEEPDPMAILAGVLGNDGSQKAASTVLAEVLEAAERIDQVSPLLEDMVTRADDVRFRRVLLDAVGEDVYHRAVEELEGKPWNSVVRLARTVEQHGHDAEEMLARVARERGFHDADVASKALHYRLKGALATAERVQARQDQAAVEQAEATERATELQLMQAQVEAEPWWLAGTEQDTDTAGAAAGQAEAGEAFADQAAVDQAPALPGEWWAELRLATEEEAGAVEAGSVAELRDQAEAEALQQSMRLQQAVSLGYSPELTSEELNAAQIGVLGAQFHDPQALVQQADEMQELQDAQAVQLQREQDWMTQVMATQLAPSLQAGQAEQLRHDMAVERAAEAAERGSWNWRLRHVEGEVGDYARGLVSEIVEPRERALAEELAGREVLPEWAATSLGPVPAEDDPAREEWLQRAADVMQYREAHSYDNEKLAIGSAPAEGAVEVRASWNRAWRALGEPADRRDLTGATDRDLRELVDRYRREELWAPAHVADQMQVTYESQQDLIREAAQMRIRAGEVEATDPEQAAALRDEAETYTRIAAEAAERAEKLEVIHQARQGWYEETTETRERAELAKGELDKRGVPVDEPEVAEVQWPEEDLESAWAEDEWDMPEPEAELAEAELAAPEAELAEVEQAEATVEQAPAADVEQPQPAAVEVEAEAVREEPAAAPAEPDAAPVEQAEAEVEQPAVEVTPAFHAPEVEADEAAVEAPAEHRQTEAPAAAVAVDEGEWNMPEPEELPELPEPSLVDTFAQAEEARRAEVQRSALENEMRRQDELAASTRAEREESGRVAEPVSGRERQDQALAEARAEIRDMDARRNAIEVRDLEGPALDDAVGVALQAKDILAERASVGAAAETATAEPPAPAVEKVAAVEAPVIERAALQQVQYYGGGLQ
ncbi:relaxase domain-containing protein [Streptomyces kaniharaensis]|uniref:Relaxase domain-containing protein n=1 Tax=Streptomyces kaniharaensis TaxID=212423 RepID=A0A6N7L271_9ACTN|nr:MobF family relaxase [Streptomyces kaniharaensis]MQS17952.1 relaxase domain-containing protein [Streptomyces kaniharaensis]